MADDFFGGGGSSSGSSGGDSGFFTGATTKAKKARKPPDPNLRLRQELQKMRQVLPTLDKKERDKANRLINRMSQGLSEDNKQAKTFLDPNASPEAQKYAGATFFADSGLNMGTVRALSGARTRSRYAGGEGADLLSAPGLFAAAGRQISKPVQAVQSTIAEASRQGETAEPFKLGPLNLNFRITDPGAIATAGREGFFLKRRDTPSSIIEEAITQREKEGSGTGPLATGWKWSAENVPGARLLTDLVVGAAVDPTTYLSFGASSWARRGLEVTADVLGAEKAAQVARYGTNVLDDAERAELVARSTPELVTALDRGARGGIQMRAPFSHMPRTVLPTKPITEAAGAVTERVAALPRVGAPVRFAQDVGEAVSTGVRRAFVPRSELVDQIGPDAARQLHDIDVLREGTWHSTAEADRTRMIAGTRASRASPEQLKAEVGPALDIGNAPMTTPELAPAYDAIDAVRRDIDRAQIEHGLLRDPADIERALNDQLTDLGETGQGYLERAAAEAEATNRRVLSVPSVREARGLGTATERVGLRGAAYERAKLRLARAEAAQEAAIRAGANADELAAHASEVAEAASAARAAEAVAARPNDLRSLFARGKDATETEARVGMLGQRGERQLAETAERVLPGEVPLTPGSYAPEHANMIRDDLDNVARALDEDARAGTLAPVPPPVEAPPAPVLRSAPEPAADPQYRPSNVKIVENPSNPSARFVVHDYDGTPMRGFKTREEAEAAKRTRQGVIKGALSRRANKAKAARAAAGAEELPAEVAPVIPEAPRPGSSYGAGYDSLTSPGQRNLYRAELAKGPADEAAARLTATADKIAADAAAAGREQGTLWGSRTGAANQAARSGAREADAAARAATREAALTPALETKLTTAGEKLDDAIGEVELRVAGEQVSAFDRGFRTGGVYQRGVSRFKRIMGKVDDVAKQMDDVIERLDRGVVGIHEYMPHVLTDEGRAFLRQNPELSNIQSGIFSRDPFTRERTIRDLSARQINDQLSSEVQNLLPLDQQAAFQRIEFFDENPVSAFAVRSNAARKAIAGRQMLHSALDIRDGAGAPILQRWDDLPTVERGPLDRTLRGNRVLPGDEFTGTAAERAVPRNWTTIELATGPAGEVEKYVAPTAVADIMQASLNVSAKPGEFLKLWDDTLQWWKTMATVPIPTGLGFHLRNATSNFMLNWLSGMGVGLDDYLHAQSIQWQMWRGARNTGDPLAYLGGKSREIAQESLRRDVQQASLMGQAVRETVGVTQASPFLTRTRGQQFARARELANPLSARGAPARAGRAVSSTLEENSRLAHFIAAERKLGDYSAAARSTKRWLFDYGDVTKHEQWAKRFMPFYTWTRKSLSATAESMIRDPRYLAHAQRAKTSLNLAGPDLSGDPVPEYLMRDPSAFAVDMPEWVPGMPGGTTILTPEMPWNTAAEDVGAGYGLLRALPGAREFLPDTGDTVDEAARIAIGQLGGPAMGVLKAGVESLTGRSIFSGAPIRDEAVPAPRPLNFIPFLSRPRQVDGETYNTISAKQRNLFRNLMPMIGQIEGLWPYDPADKEKQGRRFFSLATGIPAQPLGPSTKAAEEYRRIEIINQYWRDLEARTGTEKPELERQGSGGFFG